MESLQHISQRLRAVKNVGKITKAMEVVSATKMRKSQEIALATRPYSQGALELLYALSAYTTLSSVYTLMREPKHDLVVVVSSDRGLAGSFNAQVFRAFESFLNSRNASVPLSIITVGKKAARYVEKRGYIPTESYVGFGDFIETHEIEPLILKTLEGYREERWDRVYTVSTHFRTTLRQDPLIRMVLPATQESMMQTLREITPQHGRYSQDTTSAGLELDFKEIPYLLEPSPDALVDTLIPILLRAQLYQLILEANASEHSARRVAMKTASDNASELADTLALTYNKARQAGITNEIIEITSTQTALSG